MMRHRVYAPVGAAFSLGGDSGRAGCRRKIVLDDLYRLREVSGPEISPEGEWVAYTVSTPDTSKDQADSDVWMTSWDGRRSVRLTTSKTSEHTPRWSPDGRYLAFLSSRDDAREVDQVWLLNRTGGEAEKITDLPGGVSDYAWSPDGKRLALIASDPDPDSATVTPDTTKRTPRPIVIDRFQFKADEKGYLDRRRDHLYLFDLASRKPVLLTPGEYNEQAPAWSPDGKSIAFVSKRHPDFDRTDNWDLYVVETTPGAAPRQLTTFEGPDHNPDWGGRPPSWSPGRQVDRLRARRAAQAALLRGTETRRGPCSRRTGAGTHRDAGSEPALADPHGRRRIGALPPGGRSGDPPGPGAALRRTSGATGGGTTGHQ